MTDIDHSTVRSLVIRAVRSATSGGANGYTEPEPLEGFQAAMLVRKQAEEQVHRYAKALRGQGRTWAEIADLMELRFSDDYHRPERAYELVRGENDFDARVYWRCTGPLGCDAYITDHGPYDGHPADTEDGHAVDCPRHRDDILRYTREQEEAEERADRADRAMRELTDPFAQETVRRARWVLAHGGQYQGWSTSESLAVALALRDGERLTIEGYSTRKAAIERVFGGMGTRVSNPTRWLATVRTAATGLDK